MASKKRRYDRNFVAIPFETSLALTTLAQDNAVIGALTSVLSEDLYAISCDCTWVMKGSTAGEGPVNVGLMHSDYSATELEEYLDSDFINPGDLVEQEKAKRGKYIRKVGTFFQVATDEILNDGKPIRTKLKFVIEDGKTLSLYAENRGAGATTGRVVSVTGTIYGKWLR